MMNVLIIRINKNKATELLKQVRHNYNYYYDSNSFFTLK